MLNPDQHSPIFERTRDLCQFILAQPSIATARQNLQTFMGDPEARAQYRDLVTRGEALQQQQQDAVTPTEEEMGAYHAQREKVLANPVASGFLEAQQHLREVYHTVCRHLSHALETGQVPRPEDLQCGECGDGCSCGH